MGEFLQENHAFLNDIEEVPLFSRRDLFVIMSGGIASALFTLFIAKPVDPRFDFAFLLFSINTVSILFVTGLFSFLTAGVLLSSRASRLYLLDKAHEIGARKAFLLRVFHVLVFTSLFAILSTISVFLYSTIPGIFSYNPLNFGQFAFFPAVLGASIVGSVILALMASSLAAFVDDSRLCVVLGCVSTILIAFLAGLNLEPSPGEYSLTRILAFLSPHNVVRALAIALSGYQFESAGRMAEYVGFTFSTSGVALVLLLLGSIAIVLLFFGQSLLARNSARWTVLAGMIPSHETWDASISNEKCKETTHLRRSLRIQRGLTTLVIGVLLVSMMVGGLTYVAYMSNSVRSVLYISPDDGEKLSVGWNVVAVNVKPPSPGLFNHLRFTFNMLAWGNASGALSFYINIIKMDPTEFDSLDEASRFELVTNICNVTEPELPTFHMGSGLEEFHGSCICVLHIIADPTPMDDSYIEASLFVVQEGM